MTAILIVPSWVRPGSAIDYLATDGAWHPAVVAFLTADKVVIELADGSQWDIPPEAFAEGEVVRRSTAKNVVSVAAFPQVNVTRIGQG